MNDVNIKTVGEPITATLCLGGMCGPKGTISNESFNRRKRVQLNVLVEEDGLATYAEDKKNCMELAENLADLMNSAIRQYFIDNPDAPWCSFGPRPESKHGIKPAETLGLPEPYRFYYPDE